MDYSWLHRMDEHGETPMSRVKKSGYQILIDLLMRQERAYTREEIEGASQLEKAAYWGLSDAVTRLLESGTKPNHRGLHGETPLIRAARNGHQDTVMTLLAHGADVNTPDEYGMTSLHWVALNGRVDLAKVLIQQGADVNRRDIVAGGLTPTGMALLMGYDDLVDLLKSHGGTYLSAGKPSGV